MEEQTFLGTGWTFPPHFQQGVYQVSLCRDEQNVAQSLRILFETRLGERVLTPKFGSRLRSMVFTPTNAGFEMRLQEMIEDAILENEPRITVEEVEVVQSPEEPGRVNITVHYTIPESNNRYNFVYPFYLIEGTELPNYVRS
ncbi:MAG TPA: hypothetical protein DCE41_22300 [Cytophagales bacterium]|nr:hypothetical protein [Cytophagales bacterium]